MGPVEMSEVGTGPPAMREWAERPCDALRPFVRAYTFRDDWLGSLGVYQPLPARGDCFLQFYFNDRYGVVNVATGKVHVAARCVLVGPHTSRREDLLCTGHLRMFTIHFSAVGFRALFGVPAREIANFADGAEMVLGGGVVELESRLAELEEPGLVAVAEAFLMERLLGSGVATDGGVMARIARSLQVSRGRASIVAVAARYELSVRQVERGFLEHVGVTPKLYARLQRLEHALRVGRTGVEWAEVAVLTGYFDQSHMVREFRELNGATPVEFLALGRRAKEFTKMVGGDVAFVLSGAERAG